MFASAWLTLALACPAQNRDPAEEIRELARAVDEQLQAIDKLLLESGAKNQARSKPKELLQQARERSQTAEDGIDKLIEKLNQMKSQNSSSSSQQQDQQDQQQQQKNQQQQDQQQKQQPDRQSGGQQNRRENQTPEFVQQPRQGEQPGQPQPGQQPGQQPGEQPPQQPQPDGQPQGGQESKDAGQNTRGNRQPESATGPGNPGQGEGSWGELQPYLNALKNRGSSPKVPEKYRKYFEAYLRQQQAKPK